MNKLTLTTCLAVLAMLSGAPAMAVDVTANGGLNSEYIFRGIPQSDGDAAAFGGLDAEWDLGFFAGVWASTVDSGTGGNDGIEYDLYGGWAGGVGDFSYGVGITLYRYTDSFDDDYNEVNLTGGWRFLTVNIDIGEYENFSGPDQDYQHSLVTAEYNGFYASWGAFYDDFDGDYFTVGYGNTLTVADTDLFDYSLSIIHSTDTLLESSTDSSDTNIVVEISKTFDVWSN
ncbi:MAG: hypothetical protein JSV45_16275 [Chromatiales bacterium]|nr:MAG: hypothetical protein JSV45_16275 [Chromatiales bacterium]